jgi:hypothetical protein
MRALDLIEKLAHEHPEWVEPHRDLFLGHLAQSDKWEVLLQIVRGLPLFDWEPKGRHRAVEILRNNLNHPQKFVRAWALDSLARFAVRNKRLRPLVERTLKDFEASQSKALKTRALLIRIRLHEMGWQHSRAPSSFGRSVVNKLGCWPATRKP